MTRKRASTKQQYLRIRKYRDKAGKVQGRMWYGSVPIPRSLRAQFGDVRLVRSLKTDSLEEVNEAKWPVIAELKARISAARRVAAGLPPSLLDEAKRLRAALLSVEPGDDDALLLAVESRLESIALRHGESQAVEVAQLAHGAKTLEEAATSWIAASDRETTRGSRRSVVDVLAATMKRR